MEQMVRLRHFCFIICFLPFIITRSVAQVDSKKIVNNAYFECYGHMANEEELRKWMPFVQSRNATTDDLVAEQIKLIKENIALQKEIIKAAFQDAYGNASQDEIDSCFKSSVIQPLQVFTYKTLLNDLKVNLSENMPGLQLNVILRSYLDYFGLTLNAADKNLKRWMDSAVANNGLLYKVLKEQHKLYVVKTPEMQKSTINRAFNTVFVRDAKIAEMDSWFNACKNGGCSFTDLSGKLEEYKKINLKPVMPVLAPQHFIIPLFTRTGFGNNEGCNCSGEKIYLINADEINAYKATIASYNYKTNAASVTEYNIAPKQELSIGCTKDLECLYSITYILNNIKKKGTDF